MSDFTNPILQAAEDKIEDGLMPDTRANYMKIVVAGMHAGLAKGPDSILASLIKSSDPLSDAAKGAVSLVLILRKEAHGVMPLKAMVPAGMTLMLHALAFAERAGMIKVGAPELVKATHVFTDTVFARFGITRQGLANAANKIHTIMQDPAAMEKINLKAGLLRHPLSATPTPLPPA
jgi:hypothetical protein